MICTSGLKNTLSSDFEYPANEIFEFTRSSRKMFKEDVSRLLSADEFTLLSENELLELFAMITTKYIQYELSERFERFIK